MDHIDMTATLNRSERLIIENAKVVLSDEVVIGSVTVEKGVITALDASGGIGRRIDFAGDYLLPGLVDIHTDHFEKHVYPRAHVRWDYMPRLSAAASPRFSTASASAPRQTIRNAP
jgi:alpha-D-ribose 1-methylphosphonate 5-triphosphate diphosphatase